MDMMFLVIVVIIILIYVGIFKATGGIIKIFYKFVQEFLEEALSGIKFQRTLSKLGAFIVTVVAIIMLIKALN